MILLPIFNYPIVYGKTMFCNFTKTYVNMEAIKI
jgi:hypothetical protein